MSCRRKLNLSPIRALISVDTYQPPYLPALIARVPDDYLGVCVRRRNGFGDFPDRLGADST